MQSITDNENAISYTYNGDGLRTSKTVNGETTEYFYNGSILAGQKTGDNTLVFMYDNNSDIFGFIYENTEYYYIKNAQNDVIAIADADGNVLVNYTYDAWGEIVSITDANGNEVTDNPSTDSVGVDAHIDPSAETTDVTEATTSETVEEDSESAILARINPILYRSYYYDKETEWYYLNTRYYSPDMCRFVSADNENVSTETPAGLTDKNLFAYCDNNPVNRVDKSGNFWDTVFDVISLAVSIASVAKDPKDPVAWIGLAVDVACLVIPGITGGGALVKASTKVDDAADVVKAVNKIDNSLDAAKPVTKVHGNSLSTNKSAIGYALRKNDTGKVMKYGETTRGVKRYTKKFYKENNVTMFKMASGTKRQMHFWQHRQIKRYYSKLGRKPPWNKSFW